VGVKMKKRIVFALIITIQLIFVGFFSAYNSPKSIDGLKFQNASAHFEFYCNDRDKRCLSDFSKVLEINYLRVCKDLQTTIKNKIKVIIYPDIVVFHKAYGNPQAPNGIVASAWGDKIKMVSPLNPGGVYDYKSLMTIVIHEFTHIATCSLNPNLNTLPIYIVEGLAMHEANQLNEKSIAFLKKQVKENKIPTLHELEVGKLNDCETFVLGGGYQFSCTVIDFTIEKFGYGKLIKIIKTPSKFEEIVKETKVDFENQWLGYLRNKY
jgi:hypothetical protein